MKSKRHPDHPSPFDYIDAIRTTKDRTFIERHPDHYKPFIINRTLSYEEETYKSAAILNSYPNLPHRMQFDFLLNTIRQKPKKYIKWPNKAAGHHFNPDGIQLLTELLDCSEQHAIEYAEILGSDQIDQLLQSRGGLGK